MLNTAQFTWSGSEGTACASDLGFRAGVLPTELLVRSTRTQDVASFIARAWAHDDEGDLLYTTFALDDAPHTLVVFND